MRLHGSRVSCFQQTEDLTLVWDELSALEPVYVPDLNRFDLQIFSCERLVRLYDRVIPYEGSRNSSYVYYSCWMW
jgi:hypothetical protein